MSEIQFKRERFLAAKAMTSKGAPQASKIRICVAFEAGKTSYDINVKDLKGHSTNRRLGDNDLFVIHSLGLGVMVEDALLKGMAPTLAYPIQKSDDLTDVGLKGLVANGHGYALYNGNLSLTTDQVVDIQALPTSVFLSVPPAQEVGVVGSNVEDAAYILPEIITLSGQKDHAIRIEFGTAETDIKGETGSTAYLVFEAYGWTLQGAAK
ncbi:MAG: hypothetical protein QM751_12935 [Paludibacteraceae bacterium]